MSYVLAILAVILGGFASVLLLVLLMASTPNSSDTQLAEIRNWMIAVGSTAIVGAGTAVWMLITRRPWLAAGIGMTPAIFSLASLVYLLRVQR